MCGNRTHRGHQVPAIGFEDRGTHRDPSTPKSFKGKINITGYLQVFNSKQPCSAFTQPSDSSLPGSFFLRLKKPEMPLTTSPKVLAISSTLLVVPFALATTPLTPFSTHSYDDTGLLGYDLDVGDSATDIANRIRQFRQRLFDVLLICPDYAV